MKPRSKKQKKQKNHSENSKNLLSLDVLVQRERACLTEKTSSLCLEHQNNFLRYAEIEKQIRQLEKEKRVCLRQMCETKNLIEKIQSNTVDFLQHFFHGALLLATSHRNTEVFASSSATHLSWIENELPLFRSIGMLEEEKEEKLTNGFDSKISGILCEKQTTTSSASPVVCMSYITPTACLKRKKGIETLQIAASPQICETSIICNFSGLLHDFLLSQSCTAVDRYILETIQKLEKATSLIIGLLEDNKWKLPGFVSICRYFFSFERPNDFLVDRIYHLLPKVSSVRCLSDAKDEEAYEERGCIEFDYITGDLFFIQTGKILCFNAQKWTQNQKPKLFRLFHWKGLKTHFWSEEPDWTHKKKYKKFFQEAPFCSKEARQWAQAFQKVAFTIENVAKNTKISPIALSSLSPCVAEAMENQKSKLKTARRMVLRQNKIKKRQVKTEADPSWSPLEPETNTKQDPNTFQITVLSRRELRNNRINFRKQCLR